VPVPVTFIETTALLGSFVVNETTPVCTPAADGVKRTTIVWLEPAATLNEVATIPEPRPSVEPNCELELFTIPTLRLAVPVLRTRNDTSFVCPTVTEPKSRLAGSITATGACVAPVPVPLTLTGTDGRAGSFEKIVIVPDCVPAAVGANRSVIVRDSPGCSVNGGNESMDANSALELERNETFSGAVPVLRTVIVRVADCPAVTDPKSTVAGVTSIAGAGVVAAPATATVSPA
jgi:hypothetical protein